MANTNRDKGARFERDIRKDLSKKYPFIKTARLGSKLIDDCGIDFINIPFHIQAKSGYEKVNFNFRKEETEVKRCLKLNFPEDSEEHKKPYVLIHKKKGKDVVVQMDYQTFLSLVNK